MNTTHNPDVLSCLANLSNDEVFTPPHIANKMLDTLPDTLWSNPNAKFLDPFSKSGVFLREIAKRLLKGLKNQIPDLQTRIDHIMKEQLYGIGITELTALLTRRTLYCTKTANGEYSVAKIFDTPDGNIYFKETAHSWKNGKCTYCGASENELGDDQRTGLSQHAYAFIHNKNPFENMKFDVIIGNPPYQLSDGGGVGSSAKPIYHKFIEQAKKLEPNYLSMIVPSRWFAGGKGLDIFRENMLNDNRLKEIHDFPNASDVFPGVEIKGGVNYFLWENKYKGDCLIKTYEEGQIISEMKRPLKEEGMDIFIRNNEGISILRKVLSFKEDSFSKLVSSRMPFGLASTIKGKSTPYEKDENVKLYQTKSTAFYKRSEITLNQSWIDAHKIFVPKAIGSGDMKTDKVNTIYGEPKSACTETYLVIGPFRDKQRCENVMSYINTKFFHFVFGLKKITQNTAKGTYEFVPMQDFSKPWTDAELYQKYNLTEEEITYIENRVRPME